MRKLLAASVWVSALSAFLVILVLPGAIHAQGIAVSGAGPINRAMGGASTAAPIDAAGALLWNPASLSGLESSEISFGMELLLPTESLASTIGPYSGSTTGEPGVMPIPMMAWVHKSPDSPLSYGLGIFGIAGVATNYSASPDLQTNPLLSPPPPNGIGVGQLHSQAQFLQIVPTLSYALTEKFSIGVAPTVDLASMVVDPLFLASPNNVQGYAQKPPCGGTRYTWGGGFQVGVYYVTDHNWQYGFTFKSTQWCEPFRFNTVDAQGHPRHETARFDFPMVLSWGVAYTGFEKWLLACDVRYFDYKNAAGFGDPAAFDANGKVLGLGWASVFSVHTGVQYRASDRLFLRLGYQFHDDPIASEDAFFNIASPLIVQHIASTGITWQFTDCLSMSLAYLHGFDRQSTGVVYSPTLGPIPGSSVTNSVSTDSVAMGVNLRY